MAEKTTLAVVGEVGMFGQLNMQDPTVTPIENLMEKTTDPYLKQYLEEQLRGQGAQGRNTSGY